MRVCPFCLEELQNVQDGTFISTWVCQGCQNPQFKTIFEETVDNTSNSLMSNSFRLNDFYVTRRYKDGLYSLRHSKPLTVINKDVIGYLAEKTPIILSKPIVEFDRIIEFNFSDIIKLEKKLYTYVWMS